MISYLFWWFYKSIVNSNQETLGLVLRHYISAGMACVDLCVCQNVRYPMMKEFCVAHKESSSHPDSHALV